MIFQNEKLRPFFAAFCALGWSLAYPLIKMGYSELQIGTSDLGSKILFAGIRFFAAGILVLLTGMFLKKDLCVKHGTISILLQFALVNTALHYLFSYIGLSYIASSRSTILDSMGGFFLIILSSLIFKDDTFNGRKIVGCLLGILGIVMINLSPSNHYFQGISFMGDGMILLNACCTAAGGILTRIISQKMDMMTATGYGMGIGGLMLIVAGYGVGIENAWNLTGKGIIIMVALILISAVCFGIYNMLLAYHPISKVACYNALIPVFGVIFASVLLCEPFRWQYFLAGGIVALGIYVINGKEI